MLDTLVLIFTNITVLLLLGGLAVFVILALQYRKIKSFQFQMSAVLLLLISSEIIDVLFDFDYVENHLLQHLGSFMHVIAMAGIALVFWGRYLHAQKTRKSFAEDIRN